MLEEQRLAAIANRMAEVPGVVGVVLGGSRTRGEHYGPSPITVG